MPLREQIREFISAKKVRRKKSPRGAGSSNSGTATPHTIDNSYTTTNAVLSENPLPEIFPVGKPSEVPKESGSAQNTQDSRDTNTLPSGDARNLGDGSVIKTLMAIDMVIEVVSIVKEASEASSILTSLNLSSSAILKLLQAARVSDCPAEHISF